MHGNRIDVEVTLQGFALYMVMYAESVFLYLVEAQRLIIIGLAFIVIIDSSSVVACLTTFFCYFYYIVMMSGRRGLDFLNTKCFLPTCALRFAP